MSQLRVSSIVNLSGQPLVTKDSLGLGSVDNTSDLDKPVSVATQAAIDSLSQVSLGGLGQQALAKFSGSEGDYGWRDIPHSVIQKGGTVPSGSKVLSRTGAVPTELGDIIPITSGRTGYIEGTVVARSAPTGSSKVFKVNATVKNSNVTESVSALYGDIGTEAWTVDVEWNSSLAGVQLVADVGTGYSEGVTWEAMLTIMVV
jgi:hypothetical protein